MAEEEGAARRAKRAKNTQGQQLKSSKGHSWAYTDLKLVRRSDGEVRLLASTSDHELIFVDPTPPTDSDASDENDDDAVFQAPLRAKVRYGTVPYAFSVFCTVPYAFSFFCLLALY